VPSFTPFAVGFAISLVVSPLLMRWAVLMHTALSRHGGDFLGAPKRRLMWMAPLLFVLHPAPYLLIALILILTRVHSATLSTEWVWGILGFVAYLALVGTNIFVAVARRRRLRSASNV